MAFSVDIRDKGEAVIYVGDDESQSIEIKATVANRGNDPSYATSLYTTYPEELLDLSTSTRDWVSQVEFVWSQAILRW